MYNLLPPLCLDRRMSPSVTPNSKQSLIPFAVVGSERNVIVDGKPVRGRKNKWGIINVENEQHCDFNYLRNFLMRCVSKKTLSTFCIQPKLIAVNSRFALCRTHLQDLIETTALIHYEAFRSKQLLALKESTNKQASHQAPSQQQQPSQVSATA